ncbi:hypothetical protein PsorP6_019537 [Peronosclerospora sorghi]|nr:hypothetical protein PsorP6_019537 [Peronosclerospora sorghi]
MAWIRERFLQLIQSAGIVLQILGMLGIHGQEFALGGTGSEQGRDEKLGKAIQRVCEVVTEHVKVVGRVRLQRELQAQTEASEDAIHRS